ncbi:MAG TPA: NADH-ubiquinone oxidoreductase-F iron-sulfur binding region domain-containing protein [Acidimicrobiales bacterium]|nr:NADH-ubiquinone oxidoreductase-F iron-sulfur binding region domain-containing protein [Acidimicrobiales bacterium]
MAATPFLLGDPVTSLDGWLAAGGGQGLARARELGPALTIQELRLARLRGRGGGGFPTGRKWDTVRRAEADRRYVVCNAAEGEPATFKDRALMRANPYQAIEGLAVAALCVGAEAAFVGMKASFTPEREAVTRALQEMTAAGLLGELPVTVVAGPEEYLLGEEKALLEVIEGKDPLPRLFPPFEHGLFASGPQQGWESTAPSTGDRPQSNPTVVNNLETLANVPHILARGAEWFRSMGSEESPGTLCCTVVGDVTRPAVLEVEMGTPLGEVIERCGGLRPGRQVRAVLPGAANAVLGAGQLGTALTYEDMAAAGSGLGAAGFAVYDDSGCMVEVTRAFSRFLYVESCGQCRSCKFGTGEITRALEQVVEGRGGEAEIELIGRLLRTVTDQTRCYLATEEQVMVASMLRTFPEEFTEHLEGRCRAPEPRRVLVPKVVELAGGAVVYDESQERKQPDWTYLP